MSTPADPPPDSGATPAPDQRRGVFVSDAATIYGTVIGSAEQVIIQPGDEAYDVRGLPNPYLGLRSFSYADRASYAGRRAALDRAMGLLTTPGEQRTLLFVTGASGSGKSSFAQAGLLPALEAFYTQRKLPTRHAVIRPARQPLASLADALLQLGLPASGAFAAAARFVLAAPTPAPAGQVALLVLDQFEELFTQSDAAQRDDLFVLLAGLPAFAELHMHIVATMRSDYLPELFQHKTLYEVAKQGIDLRAMSTDELHEAILAPLHAHYPGGEKRFEADLLERLVHDAAGDAAYLPLLQVTLEDLWDTGLLTLAAYDRPSDNDPGLLTRAIRRRAEQVCRFALVDGKPAERPATDQAAITSIFLDLVEVSLDDDPRRDVRRRRSFDELERGDTNRARLIEDLVAARLLSRTVDRYDGPDETDVVDIIHETLIRNWDRLRQAISEQRRLLQARARFEQAVRDWLASERSNDYLLDGVRLAEAQDLDKHADIALSAPVAQQLLRDSLAQAEATRRRQLQRARLVAAGFAVLALAALLATGFAVAAQQRALAQSRVEEAQKRAFAARSLFESQPETALLLAYEAATLDHNLLTEQALRDALDRTTRRPLVLPGNRADTNVLAFSPDGALLLTGDRGRDSSGAKASVARLWRVDGTAVLTLTGHTEGIHSVAFSPDGTLLLTASGDGSARLWNLDGSPRLTLAPTPAKGLSASFSPDGQRILTAGQDGTARLWNLQGTQLAVMPHTKGVGQALFSPDGQTILTESRGIATLWDLQGTRVLTVTHTSANDDNIRSLAFSPDGQQFLTTNKNSARLWSRTGQRLADFRHDNIVQDAVFSPDGQQVLTASTDRTARLWRLDGTLRAVFVGHTAGLRHALFCPAGTCVLTVAGDGTLRLWALDGRAMAVLSGHQGGVNNAAFSPDGATIASVSSDGNARLWLPPDNQFAVLRGHSKKVRAAAFSPDGQTLMTAADDATARLWDLHGTGIITLTGHTAGLTNLGFSPDGRTIVTTSDDKTAKLWDVRGTTLLTITGHEEALRGARFSRDGRRLLTYSADHTARLWDAQGHELARFVGHDGEVTDANFSPDEQRVVTASPDGTARLWDIQGKLLATLSGHSGKVIMASFSPDGSRILTASHDGTARLWDLSGKEVVIYRGHSDDLNSAVFSADGQRVLTASDDGTARLWQVGGRELAVLRGHTNHVISANFSTAGDYIVTASDDFTARLWDTAGKPLAELTGHSDILKVAIFSPDGRRVLTAGNDGLARLYLVRLEDLLATAACRVGRGLNASERNRFGIEQPALVLPARCSA